MAVDEDGKERKRPRWHLRRQEATDASDSSEVNEDDDQGARVADDQRSKSSADVRDGDSPSSSSKPKKVWSNLKKSARRFRSRSRDKSRKQREERLSASQPDMSDGGSPTNNQDFDSLFDAAERRGDDRSFSDPSMGNGMTEGDSGIAVVDQSKKENQEANGPHKESHKDSKEKNHKEANGSHKESHKEPKEHNKTSTLKHLFKRDKDEASAQRNKESVFRSHPFFQLDVHLKEGRDLVVRDSCGTSDPYVKFKIQGKQLYKSRTLFKNLNPQWNERFSLPIEDPFKPIQIRVFDYDKGLNDDSMGGVDLMPTSLEINKNQEVKLVLQEKTGKKSSDNMGYIILGCTLIPKTQDEKELYFKKNAGKAEANKKLKTQVWSGVVTIVLVEGINLLPMDDNGYSDPYCKFRMGDEKYKSKYKPKTLSPRWLEQFDLRMFDATTAQLEVSVWDHDTAGKDDIMGRAVVDLTEVRRETTHTMDVQLEDGAGIIRILLTISGTQGSDSVSDLSNYTPNPKERDDIVRKYDETDSDEPPKPILRRVGQGLVNSVKSLKDIGWLQVKVIKAQGLAAADIGGKSDPFCVLELVNSRLQTQTEYKTLAPEWGKLFSFQVRDIHSVLEVTVFDEDRDKKAEFLGKIAIPLLRIRRKDRRWFQLKDKKSLARVKGAILLEMDLIFNHFKAAIRTFNPREEKYMQAEPKFKIPVMKRNIDRVSRIAEDAVEGGKFIQSCFDWESKPRSITAFIVFLVIVWNFELYMVPITLLIVFFKNLLVVHIAGNLMKDKDEDEYVDEEDDDEEEEKDKGKGSGSKEEKKSFKEKLQQIQEVCLQVQEGMDMVASGGERVKNTFNWTVPWLSWLAIIVLSIGTVVLYFVPLRYLILAWGINKFTKKLRAPNAIPNNELLDYLSRIPSDKELIQYRELRPDPGIGTMKKKRQ